MEAMHALDILTEDCWREVFKQVWGPEDLKSCSETCTTFEGILERKKTTWMFHTILSHVLPYLPLPVGPRRDWRRAYLDDNWNAMYTCRHVCKGWRQGVDHYLEAHTGYFLREIDQPTNYNYWFPSEDEIVEFSEVFEDEDFTGNPFIGRFIHINYFGLLIPPQVEVELNQDQEEYYIVALLRILNRFGSEIWSLRTEYSMGLDQLGFCKNIQILLGMLPNLKSLQLGEGGEVSYDDYRYRWILGDPEMSQLSAFLDSNPLPDHPNLESLALDALGVEMILPLLEKYGPQLKRLQLCDPKRFQEKVHRFQCLKELEIWSCNANESLNGLRQLQSPLDMLHVHVRFDDTHSTWPIQELIQNVLHLPITEVRISSWNYLEGKWSAFPATLQHGSVRRVFIASYTTSNLSCNFLRCFPNLEEIHFDYPRGGIPKPGYPTNLLIVKNTDEDMYESAVWEVLPHLQIISFKAHEPWMQKEYRRSTFEMRRFEETKEILAELF